MPSSALRALILGSASLDHPAEPGGPVRLGGVPTYGGIALGRAGAEVRAVARAARADQAAMAAILARGGVGARFVDAANTTALRNAYDAEGHRAQVLLARAAPLRWANVASDVAWASHVVLGPLHGADLAADLVAGVAGAPVEVALDVQGLVRSSRVGPVAPVAAPLLPAALAAAHVVKAGAEELDVAVTALGGPPETLAERFGVRELVVTDGPRGGYVLADGRRHPYAAVPVEDAIDPTGAGDVFLATYLAARDRDAGIAAAAHRAARAAADQVAGRFVVAEAVGVPRGS